MKQKLILQVFLIFIFLSAKAQENIPPLNQKIVAYVTTTIGTKVDRGECWDLANQALKQNEAIWDWAYEYGQLIDPVKETVFPGDIIQFENVEVKYKKGNTTFTETMDHHTAIVYRVIDQDNKIFELAHQNTNFSGRKVGLSEFNLNQVTKGKTMFYRPVPSD
jgi:hypothetical protein